MSVSPVGFASDYRRTREDPASAETLSELLSLVGYEASPAAIRSWSIEKRVEAEVYAVNVHLRASDNIPRRCPRPSWMPDPWQGPALAANLYVGPSGTVLE